MTLEVPLTQGKVALIDDDDLALIEPYRWYARRQRSRAEIWYAMTNVPRTGTQGGRGNLTTLMMHRLLLGATDRSVQVDHRDHDGLNNQRANLRRATPSQNMANQRKRSRPTSSRYKGVYWSNTYGCWIAEITGPTGKKHLGRHPTEVGAAKAYDLAAADLFGEFAHLNNPED